MKWLAGVTVAFSIIAGIISFRSRKGKSKTVSKVQNSDDNEGNASNKGNDNKGSVNNRNNNGETNDGMKIAKPSIYDQPQTMKIMNIWKETENYNNLNYWDKDSILKHLIIKYIHSGSSHKCLLPSWCDDDDYHLYSFHGGSHIDYRTSFKRYLIIAISNLKENSINSDKFKIHIHCPELGEKLKVNYKYYAVNDDETRPPKSYIGEWTALIYKIGDGYITFLLRSKDESLNLNYTPKPGIKPFKIYYIIVYGIS